MRPVSVLRHCFILINLLLVLFLSDEEAEETSCISPGDAEIEPNKEEKKEVDILKVVCV